MFTLVDVIYFGRGEWVSEERAGGGIRRHVHTNMGMHGNNRPCKTLKLMLMRTGCRPNLCMHTYMTTIRTRCLDRDWASEGFCLKREEKVLALSSHRVLRKPAETKARLIVLLFIPRPASRPFSLLLPRLAFACSLCAELDLSLSVSLPASPLLFPPINLTPSLLLLHHPPPLNLRLSNGPLAFAETRHPTQIRTRALTLPRLCLADLYLLQRQRSQRPVHLYSFARDKYLPLLLARYMHLTSYL